MWVPLKGVRREESSRSRCTDRAHATTIAATESQMGVSLPTTKHLFARSANRCAFPDCDSPLVRDDGVVVGRICHIKASSEHGPRYDPSQDDNARHGYENLMLLCPAHHDVIDKGNASDYTVDRLVQIKQRHERNTVEAPPDERAAQQLLETLTTYTAGVSVGLVSAQTVQFAQGDIHNHREPQPTTPRAADREVLSWIEDLFDTGLLEFLRSHDFRGTFPERKLFALDELLEGFKRPQREFVDGELEQLRKELQSIAFSFRSNQAQRTWRLDDHHHLLSIRTFTDLRPDLKESQEEAEARSAMFARMIDRDVELLNGQADVLHAAYRALIRLGRSKFG